MKEEIHLRLALPADIPALAALIDASVRGLQAGDYTPSQIAGALQTVYGVDSQLITDGSFFVAETKPPGHAEAVVVGCGGWSKRRTLYGADHCAGREDSLLDPERDAAKIRAFFVHPDWARRGIGTLILDACESAAKAAGFTRFEMGATRTGVPFYRRKGYAEAGHLAVPLPGGESLPVIRMVK